MSFALWEALFVIFGLCKKNKDRLSEDSVPCVAVCYTVMIMMITFMNASSGLSTWTFCSDGNLCLYCPIIVATVHMRLLG